MGANTISVSGPDTYTVMGSSMDGRLSWNLCYNRNHASPTTRALTFSEVFPPMQIGPKGSITHPHQDHYGLVEDVSAGWRIYSGVATERLIRLSSAIFGKELPHGFHQWKSGAKFEIGPFAVTPRLAMR